MFKIQQAETASSKLNSQRSQPYSKSPQKKPVYSNKLDADLAQILSVNPSKDPALRKIGNRGCQDSRNQQIAFSAKSHAKQSGSSFSSRGVRRDNSLMGLKKVDTYSSKKVAINPEAKQADSVAVSRISNKNIKGVYKPAGSQKRARDNWVSSYQVSNSDIGFHDDKSISGLSFGTNDHSRVNSGQVKLHLDKRVQALRNLKKDQNFASSRNTESHLQKSQHHSKNSSKRSQLLQGQAKSNFGQHLPMQYLMAMPSANDLPVHSNTSESLINVTLTDNERKASEIGLMSQAHSNPDLMVNGRHFKQYLDSDSSGDIKPKLPLMARQDEQLLNTPERRSLDSSDLRMTQRQLEAEIKIPHDSSAKKRMNMDSAAIQVQQENIWSRGNLSKFYQANVDQAILQDQERSASGVMYATYLHTIDSENSRNLNQISQSASTNQTPLITNSQTGQGGSQNQSPYTVTGPNGQKLKQPNKQISCPTNPHSIMTTQKSHSSLVKVGSPRSIIRQAAQIKANLSPLSKLPRDVQELTFNAASLQQSLSGPASPNDKAHLNQFEVTQRLDQTIERTMQDQQLPSNAVYPVSYLDPEIFQNFDRKTAQQQANQGLPTRDLHDKNAILKPQERFARHVGRADFNEEGQKRFIFDTVPLSNTDISDQDSPLRLSNPQNMPENRETRKNTQTKLLMQRLSSAEQLESIEIDEDERLQLVSTLTKLRPMLEKYNTEDMRVEANNSHKSAQKNVTDNNLDFGSLINAGVKPTRQVTEKALEYSEPSKRETDRQTYDQSVSQRINNVINEQNACIEALPTVKRGVRSAHKKTETMLFYQRHNRQSIYLQTSSRQQTHSRRSTYKSSRIMSGDTPDFTRDDIDPYSRRQKSKANELVKMLQVYEEVCDEKLSPRTREKLAQRLSSLQLQ